MASIHSSLVCWSSMDTNLLEEVGAPLSATLLWDEDVVVDLSKGFKDGKSDTIPSA